MEQSSRALIVQLLSSLQGALQLPAGLRVLGYLRRMGVFTELVLIEHLCAFIVLTLSI